MRSRCHTEEGPLPIIARRKNCACAARGHAGVPIRAARRSIPMPIPVGSAALLVQSPSDNAVVDTSTLKPVISISRAAPLPSFSISRFAFSLGVSACLTPNPTPSSTSQGIRQAVGSRRPPYEIPVGRAALSQLASAQCAGCAVRGQSNGADRGETSLQPMTRGWLVPSERLVS